VRSQRVLAKKFRARSKAWPKVALSRQSVGASVQLGKQLLPPSVGGDNNENVYGVDVQFVIGRLRVRGECMAGNMPSTLLGQGFFG